MRARDGASLTSHGVVLCQGNRRSWAGFGRPRAEVVTWDEEESKRRSSVAESRGRGV